MDFSYQSFFWKIGTTSFRTKQFNRMIEEQLHLLNDFWKSNKICKWDKNIQEKYYHFMKEQDFIVGNEINKAKHAREKTSGLVDLGLIHENRRLTEVGYKILEISVNNTFSSDNALLIEKDSFIYMKQLLKTSYKFNREYIRPFILLLYLLVKLDKLSFDEFKYLLPLCINSKTTTSMLNEIEQYREHKIEIDDIIINKFMSMDNYKNALKFFINHKVCKNTIITIGMNRKSKKYDEVYYKTYLLLYKIYIDKQIIKDEDIQNLYKNLKTLKLSKYWIKNFFDNGLKKKVTIRDLKNNTFTNIQHEDEFKKEFFKFMHLCKIKSTLDDYFDLNKRYIGLTDIIIFQDNEIKLDIIPSIFFTPIIDELYKLCYTESDRLVDNIDLKDISNILDLNEDIIISNYKAISKGHISSIQEINDIYYNNRYERFNKLLEERFNNDTLMKLLDYFKDRNDNAINQIVTFNADIPTIFEYISGIIWYKVSDKQGDILKYMKLSLDSDLLPKTHASGGTADIIYQYEDTDYYPKHSLLIEVTLTEKTNQRRSEMEPVSRHLGDYLLENDIDAYCIFITNYLNINVLSDFRVRKDMKYYSLVDNGKFINGMKIIPIEIDIIKIILEKNFRYQILYKLFDDLYKDDIDSKDWCNNLVDKMKQLS